MSHDGSGRGAEMRQEPRAAAKKTFNSECCAATFCQGVSQAAASLVIHFSCQIEMFDFFIASIQSISVLTTIFTENPDLKGH